MHNKVMAFIDRFTLCGKLKDTITTFTQGCCYWFAYILHCRFSNSIIMYDPVINHFVVKIEDRLYDITGDVTGEYNVVRWSTYPDESEKRRIIRDCIKF